MIINYHKIQAVINWFGIDVRRYPTRLLRNRMLLIKNHNIDLVIDVGANQGQYATELRRIGYTDEIISFEPLNRDFEILKTKSKRDKNWSVENLALGSNNEESIIHISESSPSSSILMVEELHMKATSAVKYVSTQKIIVKKLDTIYKDEWKTRKVFLKIDVQGYEYELLKGAIESLPFITGVQMEMSLVPLYKEEKLFDELIELMKSHGFKLKSIEPGYLNPKTGQLFQFDGIFFKD